MSEDVRPGLGHWSLTARAAGEPPVLTDADWVRTGIDAFVLEKLRGYSIAPSPAAAPEKLLRRVTLGLTGLPPTLEELDDFLGDPSDGAYGAVVERLLSSRRYAEHMAASWLDLARYADTDGFQYDRERPAWPWRDWVLWAFDTNLPFDRFTIEQLAGDLLPSPTEQQLLATSFNRNHPIQGENGLLLDEFRDRYVSDRVDALGKTWLGLTVGCARCHDHKYDPTTADDYYRIYDCFNQVPESDNGPQSEFAPALPIASPLAPGLAASYEARREELTLAGASDYELALLDYDAELAAQAPAARIMQDQDSKRTTRKLALGRYDVPFGDAVQCSAPHFLPPFPQGAPRSRLGLAQWLLMPEHPLTARVTVNRLWQQHFGRGLVPSLDNFGAQVAEPSYRELLDWLAEQLIASGWDMKAMHRLIVTSSTYRQDSRTDALSLNGDAANENLGRGPRFRLPAEVIRDLPLAVSGLLVERFGGPPAYPYQPAGLWEELSWESYQLSYPALSGDSLYRRSLYSFWKRTLPPPFMSLFDAPDREQSQALREPANTPEQALALLNGTQFLEAARQLSGRLLERHAGNVELVITTAFRMLTSRSPNERESGLLRETYQEQLQTLQTATTATALLQSSGQTLASSATPEAAALTQVMRVLFNLSETITQE